MKCLLFSCLPSAGSIVMVRSTGRAPLASIGHLQMLVFFGVIPCALIALLATLAIALTVGLVAILFVA